MLVQTWFYMHRKRIHTCEEPYFKSDTHTIMHPSIHTNSQVLSRNTGSLVSLLARISPDTWNLSVHLHFLLLKKLHPFSFNNQYAQLKKCMATPYFALQYTVACTLPVKGSCRLLKQRPSGIKTVKTDKEIVEGTRTNEIRVLTWILSFLQINSNLHTANSTGCRL